MTNPNIPFAKLHGAGNDYILVAEEDLAGREALGPLARAMSDRRRGIGSDGLIVVRASTRAAARMEMYNADGSRSAMCGNGLRLVAKFLADRGRLEGDEMNLESDAGLHAVRLERRGGSVSGARVSMGVPVADAARIPLADPRAAKGPGGFPTIAVDLSGTPARATCLSVGNPHCVIFVPDVDAAQVEKVGSALERDPRFPDRTNVEFAEVRSRGEVRERTWERGAGETWACGSGACATAVAAIAAGLTVSRVTVKQRGGDLEVEWEPGGEVQLRGPAELAFVGNWRPAG